MPEIVGVAHTLVQPGIIAGGAGLQHRIGQGLAAVGGKPEGIAMAEAARRPCPQLRQVGGEMEPLMAEGGLHHGERPAAS
jgi:hypothetical protein